MTLADKGTLHLISYNIYYMIIVKKTVKRKVILVKLIKRALIGEREKGLLK